MSSPPAPETTVAADVLSEPRRRYLLATLLERADAAPDRTPRTDPLSIETLATEVATTEQGCPIVTDDQCERTHVTLVHAHVPRLVDLGLLRRTTRGDTTMVGLADHPVLEADWVRAVLDDPTGESFPGDEETLNRTLEALHAPRRRAVCAVLATRHGDVSVTELAAAIVARANADGTGDTDEGAAKETHVAESLVHEHLPVLADAGLVEYDREAGYVALATDAPQWEVDWLLEGPLADAAGLERCSGRQDEPIADRSGSDEATVEGVAATEPVRDGNRMSLMLARPPVDRSSSEDASSRELTRTPGLSSTASDSDD